MYSYYCSVGMSYVLNPLIRVCIIEEINKHYILYTRIDLKLWNKLHGPMHYKLGVTCLYNAHEIYALLS